MRRAGRLRDKRAVMGLGFCRGGGRRIFSKRERRRVAVIRATTSVAIHAIRAMSLSDLRRDLKYSRMLTVVSVSLIFALPASAQQPTPTVPPVAKPVPPVVRPTPPVGQPI